MAVKFTQIDIPGVRICQPEAYPDGRGFFMETYRLNRYAEHGVAGDFVQDNYSHSSRGILRGLHFQIRQAQAKLIYVIHGEIFDAVVDVRRGSPTYKQWYGHTLSARNRTQLYVPRGLAHGFCVISETADVIYKCSDYYYPDGERGLLWSDPDIGIAWPVSAPQLSPRDAKHPCLRDIQEKDLPRYEPAA